MDSETKKVVIVSVVITSIIVILSGLLLLKLSRDKAKSNPETPMSTSIPDEVQFSDNAIIDPLEVPKEEGEVSSKQDKPSSTDDTITEVESKKATTLPTAKKSSVKSRQLVERFTKKLREKGIEDTLPYSDVISYIAQSEVSSHENCKNNSGARFYVPKNTDFEQVFSEVYSEKMKYLDQVMPFESPYVHEFRITKLLPEQYGNRYEVKQDCDLYEIEWFKFYP